MAQDDFIVGDRAVLFTDIHNYSLVAMNLADDQYGFLQEVYEELGSIVVEGRGEIIKYIGDGMLCLFPADFETKAVKCSIRLRKAYANIVENRRIPIETELEIGIDSGRVAVGVFGHESLRSRDVFGETVNLAATIGHHRGIAVTGPVYEKVKKVFPARELPEVKIKWREEPVRIWEIIESGT